VYVTPLTELATRLAGVGLTNEVRVNDVAFNDQVAKLFGLESVTAQATTVLDSTYSESSANGGDGINAAEKYGQVLAVLSGLDQTTGSIGDTLARLQDAIVIQNTETQPELILHHSAIELINQGVLVFESGINAQRSALTTVTSQASLTVEIKGGVNDGTVLSGGVIQPSSATYEAVQVALKLNPTAQAGDSVVVRWNWISGSPVEQRYTLREADVVAGVAKVAFDASGMSTTDSTDNINTTGADVRITAEVLRGTTVVQEAVPLLIDIYVAGTQVPTTPTILGALVNGNLVIDGGVVSDLTPTLTGTADPGTAVALYDNGVFIGQTFADGQGAWTISIHGRPRRGIHSPLDRFGKQQRRGKQPSLCRLYGLLHAVRCGYRRTDCPRGGCHSPL